MSNLNSLAYFWPELILTVTVLVAIIADLFYRKEESFKVAWWVLGGLAMTLFAIRIGGSAVTDLFMGSIALDPFSEFFKVLILISTALVILMSFNSNELKEYRVGEYFSVMAIMAFGLFMMASAIDILMVYLAIEVVSIMSFFLAGYLKKETRSNEASLKYVIYGAFSSGIMLYGLSILFGLTGTTKFFEMQAAIAGLSPDANLALILSAVFILAGFGYKISAVPFHFWTPDVYEGSPTTITAYLSVAPKAAGFAMLIRFFNQVFGDGNGFASESWSAVNSVPWPQLLAILAAATMTIGNLVAIQQKSVKRMLAYSSIAHAGYMMMALPLMSQSGVYGIMMYLVMYIFMNLGAFFVVIFVQNKTGGEDFEDFNALGWNMPFVGGVMTLFMIALTGLPPTAGFIGKFYIFASLIKGGNEFYWLVMIGGINSVISLFYYLRVVKVMYFEGESHEKIVQPPTVMAALLLATAIPTVLLGVYWTPIADWVQRSLVFFIQTL